MRHKMFFIFHTSLYSIFSDDFVTLHTRIIVYKLVYHRSSLANSSSCQTQLQRDHEQSSFPNGKSFHRPRTDFENVIICLTASPSKRRRRRRRRRGGGSEKAVCGCVVFEASINPAKTRQIVAPPIYKSSRASSHSDLHLGV